MTLACHSATGRRLLSRSYEGDEYPEPMQDFIKTGLFFLFILGLAAATLAAISAVVVLLVESPLFSTRQLERLAGVGMLFWTGVATSGLTALAFAAVDFADRRRSGSTDPLPVGQADRRTIEQ